jgi:hypothetical protein
MDQERWKKMTLVWRRHAGRALFLRFLLWYGAASAWTIVLPAFECVWLSLILLLFFILHWFNCFYVHSWTWGDNKQGGLLASCFLVVNWRRRLRSRACYFYRWHRGPAAWLLVSFEAVKSVGYERKRKRSESSVMEMHPDLSHLSLQPDIFLSPIFLPSSAHVN